MKLIPLTKGQFAQVDDSDHEWLMQWEWQAISIRGRWYASRNINGTHHPHKTEYMHKAILPLHDGRRVDHIDGNGLNNQRHNLRDASHAQNLYNRGINKNNTSGYKGVTYSKRERKWIAQISKGETSLRIGCFDNPIEAAKAYDATAKEWFGEFAYTNF